MEIAIDIDEEITTVSECPQNCKCRIKRNKTNSWYCTYSCYTGHSGPPGVAGYTGCK